MKMRLGFVTNSSSSSYVVKYKVEFNDLPDVLNAIKNMHGTRGICALFSDLRPSSENHLVFASGRNQDIEYLFDDLEISLYETNTEKENW